MTLAAGPAQGQAAIMKAIAVDGGDDYATSRAVREPREKPEARKLHMELRNTIRDWHTHNRFGSLAQSQRTRACWHSQRTGTGRYGPAPHGEKQVFPWPGAPDVDSLLVDQMVREHVDIYMLAWIMGQRSVRPRDVMNDEGHRKSEAWRAVMDFELDQTERQRVNALELFFNCMGEMNCAVWLEDWRQQWRRGRKTMSLQQIFEAAAAQIQEEIEMAGGMAPGDLMDQVINQVLVALYDAESRPTLIEWVKAVDPLCPEDEAKRLLAQWRNGNHNDTPYFAPVPQPGHAAPRALIPGIDCLWPVLSQHHQLPSLDVFEWLTGAEVRARAVAEGWDADWTKKLLENHRGMVVDWNLLWGSTGVQYDGYALNGLDFATQLDTQALRNADLYQIAVRYDWGVDKMGLLAPYRTIYHGMFEGVALSECDPSGTGRHHFMIINDEVRSTYTADFRGIAQRLTSHQVQEKALSDGLTCQSLLRAGPPIVDTMDSGADGLQPFARMAGDTRAASRGGDFKFLQVPDMSPEVVEWFKLNRERVDELMMRGTSVDPDAKRARRMRLFSRACLFFREMEMILCQNAREDVRRTGSLTLGSVGGKPVNLIISIDDLEGELDVQHKCDVAAMDLELATAKIDLLAKVVGFDRYGVTDFNKLYRILVGWVDPEISSAAITTFAQATDREKSETEALIAKVVAGNIMMDELEKDAGNPELRIQIIDQWMSLPMNQQKMAQDATIAEQMTKLREHYAFQVQQFQTNATTGRVRGTAPELKSLGESAMQTGAGAVESGPEPVAAPGM